MTDIHLDNKRLVWAAMRDIAECSSSDLANALAAVYHTDAHWRGSHPWNELHGIQAIEHTVWAELKRSFPDLERRDDIVIAGTYESRDYVAMVGHLVGRFQADWQGLPATDQVIYLRYGEVHQVINGKIVQSTVLLDVMDFIRQAGFWPMPPSLGQEGLWAAPFNGNGRLLSAQDPSESAQSLALTMAMQATLGAYDDTQGAGRAGLLTMPQSQYWHPKMMWYGPSSIGTARGLEGFIDCHQLPFRSVFVNNPTSREGFPKAIDPATGQPILPAKHYIRIGDGAFSATGGWPSRRLLHSGGNWLGLPATQRTVTLRVMDFYAADSGRIRENWVPIDMINMLLQLDVDILARVRQQFAPKRQGSSKH